MCKYVIHKKDDDAKYECRKRTVSSGSFVKSTVVKEGIMRQKTRNNVYGGSNLLFYYILSVDENMKHIATNNNILLFFS